MTSWLHACCRAGSLLISQPWSILIFDWVFVLVATDSRESPSWMEVGLLSGELIRLSVVPLSISVRTYGSSNLRNFEFLLQLERSLNTVVEIAFPELDSFPFLAFFNFRKTGGKRGRQAMMIASRGSRSIRMVILMRRKVRSFPGGCAVKAIRRIEMTQTLRFGRLALVSKDARSQNVHETKTEDDSKIHFLLGRHL